jgi:hypothetical protein
MLGLELTACIHPSVKPHKALQVPTAPTSLSMWQPLEPLESLQEGKLPLWIQQQILSPILQDM